MSTFEITASQVQNVIRDLSASNSEFKNRVAELAESQQTLAGKWEGAAKIAFNNDFNKNKVKWDEFGVLVDQYIQALQSIMEIYEKSDQQSSEIASTGAY